MQAFIGRNPVVPYQYWSPTRSPQEKVLKSHRERNQSESTGDAKKIDIHRAAVNTFRATICNHTVSVAPGKRETDLDMSSVQPEGTGTRACIPLYNMWRLRDYNESGLEKAVVRVCRK